MKPAALVDRIIHDIEKLGTAEQLLVPKAAAAMLGVTTQTLATWRHKRSHATAEEAASIPDLPYVKVGRSVRYPLKGLRRFIEDNTRSAPTAGGTNE